MPRPREFHHALRGNSRGVTLIEVLIAVAILGLVAVAFLSALATASTAIIIADERTTAESLARSQMEYIKTLDYEPDVTEYPAAPIPDEYEDEGYSATIVVEPLPDPNDGTLDGIQKIIVTVNHKDKVVLTVEDYKVDRLEGG